MAIDTAAKRRSAATVAQVWMAPGVTPDATPDQAWRQSSGWGYEGILAGAAAAVVDFVQYIGIQIGVRVGI